MPVKSSTAVTEHPFSRVSSTKSLLMWWSIGLTLVAQFGASVGFFVKDFFQAALPEFFDENGQLEDFFFTQLFDEGLDFVG
jgi:hypothetical protein